MISDMQLREVSKTETRTLYDLCLHAAEMFGDQTYLTWEKDSIVYEKSYRELAADVRKIGIWAQQESAVLNHPVHAALIGRTGYHYLATLFGTAAAGGAAVPMDVQLPKAAMIENLRKAETDVVFYDWEFHSQVAYIQEEMPEIRAFICLQDMKKRDCARKLLELVDETADHETEGPMAGAVCFTPSCTEEDLALIIFTSGTTGSAKGVMLSHANLIDNVFCADEDEFSNQEVVLNLLPVNHVFCLNGDIFITMRYGSTLALCRNLNRMMEDMRFFRPGYIRLVPMMAKAMNSRLLTAEKQSPEKSKEEIRREVLGDRLHKLASGGGYLAPELSDSLASFGITIGQGYGMSECSPKISVPDYDRADKRASVGRIVRGCEVRIADGEIQVKSPSVMMGYYRDEERTRETLTADGWLCTGDLGYVDDEGFLFLTGRKKNLIILENGENVSPEGIENLFDGEPLIQDVLVYGENQKIKAEVYPNYEYAQANGIADVERAVREIVQAVSTTLPNYSQIAAVTVRKNPFEKTSSKKIIRSRYFEKKQEAVREEEAAEKPENELQEQLFRMAAQVIGSDSFGIRDNLYDKGLDSLGSIILVEEIRKQLGKTITFHDLLKNGSIVRMEQLLSGMNSSAESYPPEKVYPLTNIQKYFAYVIRGNTTGNLPFTFELDETVDLPRLKQAIETVIDAHPGLKGNIHFNGKEMMLYRNDARKVDIPITRVSDEEWPAVKETLLRAFRYTEDDDLFHIGIWETDSSRYLLFDVAHIMGDGITMNILLEDVNRAYAGEPVERETYTFYDYIVDFRKREDAGIHKQNIRYYDELLKGSRMSRSILNRKEKLDLSKAEQNVIRRRFDRLVKLKVQYFCRQHGISENVLFLTAFNYCVMLFSNEKDVFTDSIHGGRTDGRWRRVAGPLFLTYHCRYQVIPHETTVGLLTRMGKQVMDTMQCFISVPREGEMFFQYQGDIINIREVAESLTFLPLICINTHGHGDHMGGNWSFDKAYMNLADLPLAEEWINSQEVQEAMKQFGISYPPFEHVEDGHIFDLGGIELEVIYLPGHTAGEIVLLDRRDRILFSGDGIVQHLWLQLDESLPVRAQIQSMERMLPLRNTFDTVLNGHIQTPYGAELFDTLLEALKDLEAGNTAGDIDYEWLGNVSKAHPYQPEDRRIVYKEK